MIQFKISKILDILNQYIYKVGDFMPRNPRQRRRFQINKRQQKTISLLFVCIIVLVIALIISIFFNFSKNSKDSSLDDYSQEISNTDESTNEEDIKNEQTENSENLENNNNNNKQEEKEPEDTTFTLTSFGDVLCYNTQYNDAYDPSTNSYDFSYVFEDIKYHTQIGDLTVANLETTFGGEEKGYSSYPSFNSPDVLAENLKSIGVDVLTTANNHCLDSGYSGLERTIDVLDNADISHLGTYKSQEKRDSVFIKFVKGVKLAFINYTYGTNGISIPAGKEYCVNLINKDLIASDIEAAKAKNPDVIIACMHWGTEYQTQPNSEQTELADFLFQNGVDVILGNHPHVLQPMEKKYVTMPDGSSKECFVIYSFGNFTSDQRDDATKNSIILNLKLTKHVDGTLTVDGADYVPIHMFKNLSLPSRKFRVLDLERTLSSYEAGLNPSLDVKTYDYLKTQLNSITSILGPEF